MSSETKDVSSKYEKTGTNEVTITINMEAAAFERELIKSYNVNKSKVNIPGFRKGKISRPMVEKVLGKGFLAEDAVNRMLPALYREAVREHGLEPVSRPDADIAFADNERGAEITVVITVKPEVSVSSYLGLKYEKPDSEVSDDEVNAEINKDREKNARIITVTDRPLQNGDTAEIDFEGFVNDVPFEGGKAENHKLVIGSNSFIDTFEEQLIGMEIGGERDITVTFPEKYHSEELSGKESVFKITTTISRRTFRTLRRTVNTLTTLRLNLPKGKSEAPKPKPRTASSTP
jgi:trigger factor